MGMNLAFWRGRRVFVTGHTGFKGSWLCLWLQTLGAEVWGFALPPRSDGSLFDRARVASGMHSETGDVRDGAALACAIERAQPEVVLHLAAQALVRPSYEDPVNTYATNVMGTVHVLEAVRRVRSVRAVVNVTTDKVYENREWVWPYREEDGLGGFDPYSSSKACSELITAAYRRSFFSGQPGVDAALGVASARAGNVIGGGDDAPNRLIPDIARAFARSEPVEIRYPQSVRPWQFVLEPLRGYLMLAQGLAQGRQDWAQAWNFGPRLEDAQCVRQVVEHMARVWGVGAHWQSHSAPSLHEAGTLRLDVAKAGASLNWHPQVPLSQALEWVVQWYKGVLEGDDARALTLKQIQAYQSLVDTTP
jgi:CDP-glucose 4,6-dehydratase